MRRVYLSFLGLGAKDPQTQEYDYTPAVYQLNGVPALETKFVQVAEAELLGARSFDLFIIVATQKSYDTHFMTLEAALTSLGARVIEKIIIDEEMSAKGQWKWFEEISHRIEIGDEITVDLTHGYRSIPIIFSTAINFLQKSRKITLKAVYYGVFEKRDKHNIAPIIDMKDFYIVNEWAEAVSRLVEDADARKMASVAAVSPGFQTGGLNDPEIIQAMEELTGTIRNVDVNHVATKARKALDLIDAKRGGSSETGRILLDLVVDKFACLAVEEPQGYTRDYFMIQLDIIRLLLEHKLYMQAYTVMRELIGSIGMVGVTKKGSFLSSSGRSRRKTYSDVFVNMIQFEESSWKFPEKSLCAKGGLEPFYLQLEGAGIVATLRSFAKDLIDYRNGFDHAWTAKTEAYCDIEKKGMEMHNSLKFAIDKMKDFGIL